MSLELLNPPVESKLLSLASEAEAKRSLVALRAEKGSSPLEIEINVLLTRIDPIDLRRAMTVVFASLNKILGRLKNVEVQLSDNSFDQTASFMEQFTAISVDARNLLNFIQTVALPRSQNNELLSEILDSTCYAIKHELGRVFDEELYKVDVEQSVHLIRAKFTHASGLLRNCFEQSIITLGKVFDPLFDADDLFNDLQARLDQSLAVCRDLSALIDLARLVEQRPERASIMSLAERLKKFRSQTMHFLMYRDWEECERLVKEILRAKSVQELPPILEKFSCYLEVLLGQVKMRVVLKELAL